jgi:hypothetical protein
MKAAARLLSLVSVAVFVLFFLGEGIDTARMTWKNWLGLLFFPVGVSVGMLVGWRRAELGGWITFASLALFYLVFGWLLTHEIPTGWGFIVFSIPGLMFLAVGLAERQKT